MQASTETRKLTTSSCASSWEKRKQRPQARDPSKEAIPGYLPRHRCWNRARVRCTKERPNHPTTCRLTGSRRFKHSWSSWKQVQPPNRESKFFLTVPPMDVLVFPDFINLQGKSTSIGRRLQMNSTLTNYWFLKQILNL